MTHHTTPQYSTELCRTGLTFIIDEVYIEEGEDHKEDGGRHEGVDEARVERTEYESESIEHISG